MPSAATIHPAHAANMTAMAIRLKTYIETRLHVHDADVVDEFTDEMRANIADLAGEDHTGSDATWAVVVTLFRDLPALPTDPFANIA